MRLEFNKTYLLLTESPQLTNNNESNNHEYNRQLIEVAVGKFRIASKKLLTGECQSVSVTLRKARKHDTRLCDPKITLELIN